MKVKLTHEEWIRIGSDANWREDFGSPRPFWKDDETLVARFRQRFPKSAWTADQIIKWFRRNFDEKYAEPLDWEKRPSRDLDPSKL
jgi:hypothetical protein